MKSVFKKPTGHSLFSLALIFTLLFSPMILANGLGPVTPPEATASYSMDDLYNRLVTGAQGLQATFAEPATGPFARTSRSINEIMALAPSIDPNGALPEHVLAGKTFWGLTQGQWGPHTGTMTNGVGDRALVPRTGQTTSFRTGDDGDHQHGVEWPLPRFTENEDETVTDNMTGLMWAKNALHVPMTWDDGISYCNDFNFAEYNDWRLPNVRELQSLVDYGRCNPALPEGHPFVGVVTTYYWTSTTAAANEDYVWSVGLLDGDVFGIIKTSSAYVWPVRTGQ